MYINKIEIHNFRSHKNTVLELGHENVLIGQNNTGKTSFLQALNLALGYQRSSPSQDDFFAEGEEFDPKNSEPIKVVVEFRETSASRFSRNAVRVIDRAMRFDEEAVEGEEAPIQYFRVCYEFQFDKVKDTFIEERYFVGDDNKKIKPEKYSSVGKDTTSFFPFFYIESIRDINREIKRKSSFWGKLKDAIDYKDKEKKIKDLLDKINDMLLKDNETVDKILEKLKELENNIRITSDAIFLHAFTKRSWELLDGLNIYLKLPLSNVALPISKHGAGTQNIMVLLIFAAYIEALLPKIVNNTEATPIIGLEEPEAHIHPQAQRALLHQISKINAQKIISTHSPYIVDQADIYDYAIFSLDKGITNINKIPKYKKSFTFKYGLPPAAYTSNKFIAFKAVT